MENKDLQRLHNQDDVNPTTQMDKIVKDENLENPPKTEGTGSNRPVYNEGSVIINKELEERLSDEPDSLGVNLDGTNPGSKAHPMDDE